MSTSIVDREQRICDLRDWIAQIEMEIRVNDNPGTSRRLQSDEYWAIKNQRWQQMVDRFRSDLSVLVEETKESRNDGPKHGAGDESNQPSL